MLVTGDEDTSERIARLLEELVEKLGTPTPVHVQVPPQKPPVVNVAAPPVPAREVRAWTFDVVRDSSGRISKINATPKI